MNKLPLLDTGRHTLSRSLAAALATVLVCSLDLQAQDSVSRNGCLPGDAVSPWQDAQHPRGSEQVNDFVVDLAPVVTSFGTRFGIAPLVKTSKVSSSGRQAALTAQAIARRITEGSPFASDQYSTWTNAGEGINNDPTLQTQPQLLDVKGRTGYRTAIVFGEYGTTDSLANYHGIVVAQLGVDRSNPTRILVRRIQAAVNGCNDTAGFAGLFVGAVDEAGTAAIRTDDVSNLGSACGLLALGGSNYFMIQSALRNPAVLNVISAGFPGAAFDAPTTRWAVRNDATTSLNTPSIVPASITGGPAILLGSNFGSEYLRGPDFGMITKDFANFGPGVTGVKGNMSYTKDNFARLNATHGTAALLGKVNGTLTDSFNVFGLGPTGSVTGTLALTLPASITDNATGFKNLPGQNQFDHYRSQTFSNGGNGTVAVRVTPGGDLLLAAEVDHPNTVGSNWGANYLAVARVSGATGIVSWTMAAYVDNTIVGKPILNGSGSTIGTLVPLVAVLPLVGPSVSGPAFDSAGNLWFLSGVDIADERRVALLRAVFDPVAFSFDLELVAKTGDIFKGANSGCAWRLEDLRIADYNSVDSATLWSGNVTDDAFLGYPASGFPGRDPRSLGGLVLAATIRYDRDGDGLFTDCQQTPRSTDEAYTALLYLGSVESSGMTEYGQLCSGSGNSVARLTMLGWPRPGSPVTLRPYGGLGGSIGALLLGLNPASIPLPPSLCQLLVAQAPVVIPFQLGGSGPGQGAADIALTIPGSMLPAQAPVAQAFWLDPGAAAGFVGSNGIRIVIQ